MQIFKSINKGPGLMISLGILLIIFAIAVFIVYKSTKKNFLGRILIPLAFIEVALLFFLISLGFPQRDEVGPAIVPRIWIAGLIGLSLFILIRALIGYEEQDPKAGRIDKVLLFIGLTILYLYLIQYIGYFISTFIFIIAGMSMLSYRNVKVMVAVAGGWLIFSYFAFYKLLYVPLPVGKLIELIF